MKNLPGFSVGPVVENAEPSLQPSKPKRDNEAAENDDESVNNIDGKAQKNACRQRVDPAFVKTVAENKIRADRSVIV